MTFQIERRSNLSYAEFARGYLYANKPVVVTDAIGQWRALARWTPEFFKAEFGEMKFTINDGEKGALNYKAKGATEYTMSRFIDRVLNSTDENPAPYFRNRILYDEFPALKQDIEPLPKYFFPNWLPESYLMKSVQQVFNRGAQIELYIGGKGRAFPVLHYDGLASHAFLMQIYGQKQFILYGPDQGRYLYPTPGQPQISRVNSIEQPNMEAFPLFANAAPTKFVLEPGELLFIPSKWWHTTKMLTACISISTNVVNRSNWAALTDFVESKRKPLMRIPSRIYLRCAGSWRSRRDQRLGRARHSPA
jgi:histone arginine demethylase JMJD6